MLCAADLVCSVALLRDRLVFQVKYAWCKTRTNSNVKSLHHHSTIHRLKIWKLEKLLKLDCLSVSQLFGKWFRFMMCTYIWIVQSNLVIRNFLVTLKLFLNAKCSLSLWSKLTIGHGKWFLKSNLFLIKTFLISLTVHEVNFQIILCDHTENYIGRGPACL